MDVPGTYFRVVAKLVRIFAPMVRVESLSQLSEPCVLLCRHRNMRGPVYTIVHYDASARPWIFWPFFEKESFYAQMHGYTLTKRLRWPRPLASLMAKFLSHIVPPLIKSLGGIPVYRGTTRIRETFRLSLAQLCEGKHILIYPDVDYVSNEQVGEVYDGFFMLEKLYCKKTGRHLPFVPVRVDTHGRAITLGTPVRFGEGSYDSEMRRVKEEILSQLRD